MTSRGKGVFVMKRKLSLLLAALAAVGALSVSALATEAEPPAQESQEQTREETAAVPDPEGTVTWENLRSRIQEGSLSLQSLTESIGSIQAIDYDKMAEVLREQINAIGKASRSGGTSVSASASSLRDTFEDLLDGDYQADNDDVIWQLRDASNQVVSAGENCTSRWWGWSSRPGTWSGTWTRWTAGWRTRGCGWNWGRAPGRRSRTWKPPSPTPS